MTKIYFSIESILVGVTVRIRSIAIFIYNPSLMSDNFTILFYVLVGTLLDRIEWNGKDIQFIS